jgi:hypothetical protein
MKVTGEEILTDKVVNVKQAELPKQVKWTVAKIHRGHTLFEIDLEKFTIVEATYERTDVQLKRVGEAANLKEVKNRVMQKPNCIYISALNKNNALKKFQKQAKNYK